MAEQGGQWRFTPASPALAPNRVDVWYIHLEDAAQPVSTLAALLDADERERAARFHFDVHRRYFIVAHGMLRLILAHYLHCPPDTIRCQTNAAGKPALAAGGELRFNLSHSGDLALVAVAAGREVGVDVEFMRPLEDIKRLVARTFSPCEAAAWGHLPESQQREGFFNCWTRKEAFIKALGQGLLYPLDQFDVSLEPGEPARLLRVGGNPQEAKRWSLRALEAGAHYAAALAVEGGDWSFTSWQWDTTFATWNQV
jgi:4'-phosphopantetheinyl transferase